MEILTEKTKEKELEVIGGKQFNMGLLLWFQAIALVVGFIFAVLDISDSALLGYLELGIFIFLTVSLYPTYRIPAFYQELLMQYGRGETDSEADPGCQTCQGKGKAYRGGGYGSDSFAVYCNCMYRQKPLRLGFY